MSHQHDPPAHRPRARRLRAAARPPDRACGGGVPAHAPAYPELDPGDREPAVRTLQCAINDLGFGPVTVDGYYGPQTKKALTPLVDARDGGRAHPYRLIRCSGTSSTAGSCRTARSSRAPRTGGPHPPAGAAGVEVRDRRRRRLRRPDRDRAEGVPASSPAAAERAHGPRHPLTSSTARDYYWPRSTRARPAPAAGTARRGRRRRQPPPGRAVVGTTTASPSTLTTAPSTRGTSTRSSTASPSSTGQRRRR